MCMVADLASWGAMLNRDRARAHVEAWVCWLPGILSPAAGLLGW